jgi:hypothetical protein
MVQNFFLSIKSLFTQISPPWRKGVRGDWWLSFQSPLPPFRKGEYFVVRNFFLSIKSLAAQISPPWRRGFGGIGGYRFNPPTPLLKRGNAWWFGRIFFLINALSSTNYTHLEKELRGIKKTNLIK